MVRLARHIKRVSRKAGLSPGTLVVSPEKIAESVKITVIQYNETHITEHTCGTIDEVLGFRDKPGVTWINIDGIHDVSLVERIGTHFGIHPLVLEDVVTVGQRPKVEDYGEYLFITVVAFDAGSTGMELQPDEISMILAKNYLITFQERTGDSFDPIRERLRKGSERLRKAGADYLAYALIDIIVDNYFILLERLGEQYERVQNEVAADPSPAILKTINQLKSELLYLRRAIWPLRDVISGMQRSDSTLISSHTDIYLRDVHDHTIQVMDTIDTFRDMIAGMHDIYLSTASYHLNMVMKVLTMIATIFIPLTFIAGVYGMNFDWMPELHWRWGYPTIMAVMTVLGILMAVWFKKKKWL